MNDRLYRSRDDRMIAGVAGGLAERLDLDPSLVRVVWALLVLPTGFLALLVYIVMIIVVPDEEDLAWQPPVMPAAPVGPQPTAPLPSDSAAFRAASAGAAGPGAAVPGAAPWHAAAPDPPPWGIPNLQPTSNTPPTPSVSPAAPLPQTREEWRAQRRAERAVRRAERRPGSGPVIIGAVLILLGLWFLLRQFFPALDPDRLWPVGLVGLGVVLIIWAIARRPDDSGAGR